MALYSAESSVLRGVTSAPALVLPASDAPPPLPASLPTGPLPSSLLACSPVNSQHNPYAPPEADVLDAARASGQVHRKGKYLLMPHGGVAPARCIKCNSGADLHLVTRELHWYNPLLNLLILVNLLVLIIVARIFRKKALVTYSLCGSCARRQKRDVTITWSLSLLGIGLLVAGVAGTQAESRDSFVVPLALLLGSFLTLGGILYGLIKSRLIHASKIDAEWVHVARVSQDLLAGLPGQPS
jgi:hypothetical protein